MARFDTMMVQCKFCNHVLAFDARDWKLLGKMECPWCWEDEYNKWSIIWESDEKPPHDLHDIIKKQW